MTQKIVNLRDLFVYQGREMYYVSKKLQTEIPTLISKVTDPELKVTLERELTASIEECTRIEEAFKLVNESPAGDSGEWTNWMFTRTKTLVDSCNEPSVRDAAIVNAVQQINHSKITGLGSFCAYAKEMGQPVIAELLSKYVKVEREIEQDLARVAVRTVTAEMI